MFTMWVLLNAARRMRYMFTGRKLKCLLCGWNVHKVEFNLFTERGEWMVAAKTWVMVTALVN